MRCISFLLLVLLLPLFSTAFVGQSHRRNSGSDLFLQKQQLHVLSFQKSATAVTLPSTTAALLSVHSPTSKDYDDDVDERICPYVSAASLAANDEDEESASSLSLSSLLMVSSLAMAPIVMMSIVAMPLPAMAATAAGGGAILSALWSYGHLLALLGMMGTVVAQKLLVQPGTMTKDDESAVGMLNIAYSLALALLLTSGYFRVAEFGKGVSFYSHEITFWIKMALTGVQGGLATFKTITLVKRNMSSPAATSFQPMSDKLVARMQQILNAEITGLVSIPLIAALMARGVLYWDDFPWPAGAAFTALATAGASFFYAKQALTWKEADN